MSPFEEYLCLLIELHNTMEVNDENKANEIRNKMDKPYWELSKREQEIIDDVSAALNGDFAE